MDADWPDAPHLAGALVDDYPDPEADSTTTTAVLPAVPAEDPEDPETDTITIIGTPSAPRRPGRVVAGFAVAAVFLGGSGLALSRMVTRPEPVAPRLIVAAPGTTTPDPGPLTKLNPGPGTTLDPGPRTTLDLTAATFELADDTGDLQVTVGPLGDEVARVGSPAGSGVTARAALTGAVVRVTVRPTGGSGTGRVDVVLNDRIAWAVRMTGGVRHAAFDLRGGAVSRFDLIGGAARIDMTLPRGRDSLPIRMSGGVHTWRIRTDGEVPVHAVFRRGSGPVVLNGRRVPGVTRGGTLTAGSGTGLEVDAVAGIGSLTVTGAA